MQFDVYTWKKTRNYTKVDNDIVKDQNISLKAKGLMLCILSFPPTWKFTVRGLMSILKERRDAIENTINELVDAGYATKKKARGVNGCFDGWQYKFYETPELHERWKAKGHE